MSSKIFVGNLNFDTNEQSLRTHFGAAGTIVDIHIPTNRDTGRPRGFAFVTFSNADEATQALESLHGSDLDGRTLRVDRAEDRRPSPGPRRFEGGGGGPRFGGGPRPGGGYGDGAGGPPRFKKGGGSRRGLRARKRSL